METLAQYESRKTRECALLTRIAGTPSPDVPLSGVARRKLDLTNALRRATIDTDSFAPETNWSERPAFRIADIDFTYRYQRFDIKITAPPVYVGVGGADALASPSTYFVCSGMAAAAAVLVAVDRLLTVPVELWTLGDAYFETLHMARHYTTKMKVRIGASFMRLAAETQQTSPSVILHLDSMTAADWLLELPHLPARRVVLAIVDTTCYARTDSRISDVVDMLMQLRIPTVLMRSHLKLDSLGSEYGRLGSVVLCRKGAPSAAQDSVIDGLQKLVPDVIRSFGSVASPASFFPVAQSGELLALTVQRSAAIIENARVMADVLSQQLAGQDVAVRRYHHGMFVSLHDVRWTSPPEILSMIESAMTSYRHLGRNCAHATSFGFDFPILSGVYDFETGAYMLRISPSDEPSRYMSELAGIIATTWRDAFSPSSAVKASCPE